MELEASGQAEEASESFFLAWDQAADDHERLLVAHHISRRQEDLRDQLRWLETALELAQRLVDPGVLAAVPFLHERIAEGYESLGEHVVADGHRQLARSFQTEPKDPGPFYHGTRAHLQVGDHLRAGHQSNYEPGLTMNHIYFTASVDGAGLAAALSQGEGAERVYVVEVTGSFEDDPNVTNKRFLGNPTRSYRSDAPLRIVGEALDWERPSPETVQRWREKLATSKGQIVN
ncbi:MAG: NAD(+)--rifampin ADP-ribosyltransferase [Myxococcales bacterium]|nr:NAD(+)--rifampin ADP-ribosyltransferase [Myxococcales bacterium]